MYVFIALKGSHFCFFIYERNGMVCELETEYQSNVYPANPVLLFGPRQANLVLIAYASSEGSGEPAHPQAVSQTESQIPGPSEWLGMRS